MLDLYKRRLAASGSSMGQALKNQSDMIMDNTFTRDIAYRLCYIDGNPVDAKYIVHTYYNISKDAVDYHLQFRPKIHYPIGTYVDVPDDVGAYNRWLIVGRSDEPQFVKYNILKCNWNFKWIANGMIYECLGILRARNSYNSGLWHDYYTTTPENQDQFIVPTTQITQTIDYNVRFLISDNKTNPIAWEVSKREDTFPVGITKITLKQDLFNPNLDNKELMIADYYKDKIVNTNPDVSEYKITYSGKPVIKVGGSYKTFCVPNLDNCVWKISGIDENNYQVISPYDSNQIKIKIIKDYNLIGKVITLQAYKQTTLLDSLDIEVISI